MPLCIEQSGNTLQISANQPADISQCALVALTGGEYAQVNVLAQQQIAPYDLVNGAGIFAVMFVTTASFYLVTRSMAQIIKPLNLIKRL